MIAAILGSVEVKGGDGDGPRDQGELRRLYDSLARVSIVVPALWKSLKPDSDKTLLFIALKGARKAPRFSIKDTATRLKPNLILLKISSQWKKTYGGGLQISRLGLDPPRMMVKNRIPGSIDYLIAFSAGGQGYIFQLTCREGSFEKYRAMGDAFAKTIVFAAGSWTPPAIEPRELKEVFKKLANVHASVEQTSSVDAVMRALAGFFKHWPRLAPAFDKKAPPLEILVVGTDEFKEASHFYGRPPVVYDRSTRVVVVAPRPKEKPERAVWVGRLYWALGEAALHRDLAVPAPPWLRAGFCGCIEAAGRTGKGPREPHSGYVERLLLKTETDSQMGLRDILKMTDADIYLAQKPDMKVQAWGYLHMLLYGKSVLGAAYKKWAKALKNARGRTPTWDLKDYAKDKVDLKKHAARNWAKK